MENVRSVGIAGNISPVANVIRAREHWCWERALIKLKPEFRVTVTLVSLQLDEFIINI